MWVFWGFFLPFLVGWFVVFFHLFICWFVLVSWLFFVLLFQIHLPEEKTLLHIFDILKHVFSFTITGSKWLLSPHTCAVLPDIYSFMCIAPSNTGEKQHWKCYSQFSATWTDVHQRDYSTQGHQTRASLVHQLSHGLNS